MIQVNIIIKFLFLNYIKKIIIKDPTETDPSKKNPIGYIYLEFNTRFCLSCVWYLQGANGYQ